MMSWVCDFTRLALRWQLEHGSHTSLPGKTSYFADAQPAAHLPVHDALGPGQRYIYFFWGMLIRCLSDAYPMPIRRLSDAYPTAIRCLSDVYPMAHLTAIRRPPNVFDTHLLPIRWVSDAYLTAIRGYLVATQCLLNP